MRYLLTILLLVQITLLPAQEDTLKSWKISGQWRNFYMSTFNSGSLKDFHALATGGYLRYDQKVGEKFYFSVAGYTSYNLGIQDLTVPDEATGRTSRFESRLFNYGDLSDPLVLLLGEAFAGFKSGGITLKLDD